MTTGPDELQRGISVVVPVYDAAATLDALVGRLGAMLRPLGRPYEIVLVNDGSRDDSWSRIESHAAADHAPQSAVLGRKPLKHGESTRSINCELTADQTKSLFTKMKSISI